MNSCSLFDTVNNDISNDAIFTLRSKVHSYYHQLLKRPFCSLAKSRSVMLMLNFSHSPLNGPSFVFQGRLSFGLSKDEFDRLVRPTGCPTDSPPMQPTSDYL